MLENQNIWSHIFGYIIEIPGFDSIQFLSMILQSILTTNWTKTVSKWLKKSSTNNYYFLLMQFLEPLYNKIAIIIMSTTFLARVESFFFSLLCSSLSNYYYSWLIMRKFTCMCDGNKCVHCWTFSIWKVVRKSSVLTSVSSVN